MLRRILMFALAATMQGQAPSAPSSSVRPTHAETITVTASAEQADLLAPDPAETVYLTSDLLAANPGRPGAPVSLPGYPIETASGGIKAPQYFAPGVAGDHGEPVAQYIVVGAYLTPNNLSANAHGNGYADPNILVAGALEHVSVDAGAFNVLEGNHALALAATYGLQQQLAPFVALTLDPRDASLAVGLAPRPERWVALEADFGNGLLHRLEHRQQYKLNAESVWRPAAHTITLLGIAYFGQSYVPGLVPFEDAALAVPGDPDTVDPRQHDQTHTAMLVAADTWQLNARRQVNFGGFFRTYNLSLFSNFGDGLIRQSEFRTAQGATANWREALSPKVELLGGVDFNREAPRRDNLDHYDDYAGTLALGPFTPVDSSDVTLTSVTPYAAAAGSLGAHLRYYAGWRRDEIDIANDDLLHPQNTFATWQGVNSPKATLTMAPPERGVARWLPQVSLSGAEAFFTEDPRIGLGQGAGTLVERSHAYQLVASRELAHTELRLTLGQTTSSAELAKIDPDTGLQEDNGPSRLRFFTATVRQSFRPGWLLLTVSKADARGLTNGLPVPEAPRLIADATGAAERLPLGLRLQAEFEYVGAKPLGTGCAPNPAAECVGVPVRELRLGLARSFAEGRVVAGLEGMAVSGFTGQTTEAFGASPLQQVVGVRSPSSVSLNLRWKLRR